MKNWEIGLSSWIIQDGNYEDFHINDIREFAIEFYLESFSLSEGKSKQFTYLNDSFYEIVGQVIFKKKDVCVLDFGILAYSCDIKFGNIKVGDFIYGKTYVGIDSFDYFERLFKIKGMPPLIYTWKVNNIILETTPKLKIKDDKGRIVLTYDKSKYSTKAVDKTQAWEDNDGSADYVLSCTLLSENSKHTLANIK